MDSVTTIFLFYYFIILANILNYKIKRYRHDRQSKGKVHPRTGHKGPEVE
jgi:hypothetical protein